MQGALAALRSARDVDDVAAVVLDELRRLPALPHVVRVGLALTEGGGRRLKFTSSDRETAGDAWCHIDAYEDVPLTHVVRTSAPVFANMDTLQDRFGKLAANQSAQGICALAAVPLPGIGSPIGGLVLYFAAPQRFHDGQVELLGAAARRISEAIRRVRLTVGRQGIDSPPAEPEIPEQALTASVLLEGDPRASGAGRRFLREQLQAWEVDDDTVDTAQLCLSELVTNAVVHAGTASELRIILDRPLLTVFVRDLGGPGRGQGDPHPSEDDDPLRVFGRGLMLVDALAHRWGSERDVTGTTAWFALEVEPVAAEASA